MTEYTVKKNEFLREEYYRFRHKSGLEVCVFPKKLTTYYAIFATRYGSLDNKFKLAGDIEFTEVPDGIAHYLEHKLFENPNGEDTFNLFAHNGANANAYTSTNMTAYLFSCTSKFRESLGILLDFVKKPYFTAETVEKERGIISQEIKMYEDHPSRAAYQMMLENLYEKHPVKIDVAGTVDSINKITPEILYECYRVFYNLSNMMLIVCGDITASEVDSICDEYLKSEEPTRIIREYPTEKEYVNRDYSERRMQTSKPIFAIGMKDSGFSQNGRENMKRYAEFCILNDVLFGKSGEFYNKLYEDGLLSNQFDFGYESGAGYAFNAICGESSCPEKVFEYMKDVCDRAKTHIDEEDFERSKRALYASMVKCFDSTEEIANSFLNYEMEDGDILEYTDILASVTVEDVKRAACQLFVNEKYTLAVVKPLKEE